MTDLSVEEEQIVKVVADFVDAEVRPVVNRLEHVNEYPEALIEQMKALGVYGLTVPEEYGGLGVSTACFALVTEELARGWMSLAGAFGGHAVVSLLLRRYGTQQQREHYLPRLATGALRATMALTEPQGGSDLQAITTTARPAPDGWRVSGTKMWITNARRAGLIALLCKTDPHAEPAHKGMSILLVEPGPGLSVSRDLPKLGYKGVESCELVFDDYSAGSGSLLGGVPGEGFAQMMGGLELGRIQVAARANGVARAALEEALRYSTERETFGRPIWQHQSIGNYLADGITKLTAARLMTLHAAESFDAGRRSDMQAGMAKLFASETAMETALAALRIHGGYGYSTEFEVERYFRDAPLMLVGEGTNEIQRSVIARQFVKSPNASSYWG